MGLPRDKKSVRARESERGQVSVMVGMMMLTFILFFAFVVNTGMLVNAKINLQNAADLAAYAGAAQQARTLNNISYLNYEMRRQYKKFLFRYYVVGNMAQKPFPRNGGETGPMLWSPDGSQVNYNVPAVCMIYKASDNYCQLAKLNALVIPPQTPLDNINETLRQQLQEIEKIRKRNCVNIGHTNTLVLMLWLYNTDPNFQVLGSGALGADPTGMLAVVRSMTQGVGLIPKLIVLSSRIQTLARYINAGPETGLTREKVDALQSSPDPVSKERSIEAFLSAYNTLGEHTFPSDTIMMDELLPPSGTDGANLVRLEPIRSRFDTYSVEFDAGNGANLDAGDTTPQDCVPKLVPVTVKAPVTFGFKKDPRILTYYAVRVKAKARVLFSPFGDVELKAYAAAQPFGSRIGPQMDETMFLRSATSNPPPQATVNPAGKIPNLHVFQQDSTATGQGWDKKDVVGAMYKAFDSGGIVVTGPNGSGVIDQGAFTRGYRAAMAPNPWEGNKYNIINDLGNDPFVRNFGTDHMASIYAPIFLVDKVSAANDQIKDLLDQLFSQDTGSTFQPNVEQLKSQLRIGLSQYLTKLIQGGGEESEGYKIARLQDPFFMPPTGKSQNFTLINVGKGITMNQPQDFKTSWNKVNFGDFREQGRVGYSVKYISFENLTSKKLPTNGVQTWNNDADFDPEAQGDIPYLKH